MPEILSQSAIFPEKVVLFFIIISGFAFGVYFAHQIQYFAQIRHILVVR